MVDILEAFGDQSPTGPQLEVLPVKDTPTLVTIFQTDGELVDSHYVDCPNLRARIRCNAELEGRCLACDVKFKVEPRILLPVYSVDAGTVKVLLISDAMQPYSLGPLLKAELVNGDLDKRYLMLSRNSAAYSISTVPAGDSHDMGEIEVANFREKFEAGEVDLKASIPIYTNASLWDVPELERKATALGLNRSDYRTNGSANA